METFPPHRSPPYAASVIVEPKQPNTTLLSYWLNWRFLVCAIFILGAGATTIFLIWKYEGRRKKPETVRRDDHQDADGFPYVDEGWRPALKSVHPGWLLAYRLVAFTVLLLILVADIVQHGGLIFIFYTQWTFTLVIVYFLFASGLSVYGCFQSRDEDDCCVRAAASDEEAGIYVNPTAVGMKPISKTAKILRLVFQIIYQICAGAVVLTDFVFWCVLFPFFWNRPLLYMDVFLHALNAIFLIGDTLLNSLPFPFFRIAYFMLWTVLFVIVQWIIHACIYIGWPYEFLDLSSSFAPLWYFGVGIFHLPCYGVFALIVILKEAGLSGCFPNSYRRTS